MFVPVVFFLGCRVQPAPVSKTPLTLEDLRKEVFVAEPRLSPDGKSIAVMVIRHNFDEDRSETEIDLVDVSTGAIRTLTHDRRGASSPAWSPDGKQLAFGAVDGSGTPQVFAMPMNGGDPLQVTHAPTGVNSFSWSPGGQSLAYIADEEKPKLTGAAAHNKSFEVVNDPYRTAEAPTASRLWVVPATGGEARCLTKAARPLQSMLPPGAPPNTPNWSPDGKSIYVVTQLTPSYGDAMSTNRVERVSVADGKTTPITNAKGFELFVSANPANDSVAIWNVPDLKSQMNRLSIVSAGNPTPQVVKDPDVNAFLAEWAPDGKSILTGGNHDDTVGLWQVDLNGKSRRIDPPDLVIANFFSLDLALGKTGAMVFTAATATSPSDLYYAPSPDAHPIRLTHFNDFLDSKALGESRVLRWKNDGFEENGIVTLPPSFDSKRKYPLVVFPHGGPEAASLRGFNEWDQVLAAKGYVVFEPNYRGSDNLGEKYMAGIWNDAGDGPGRDVMAGVKLLEKQGFVDPSKESVAGWSYGGYMAAWLIGHEHRWRCAITGAPVLDWSMMRTLGDAKDLITIGFRGALWKDHMAKDYAEQSPISYVDKMTTPTLIMADTGDQRVPTAQSYFLFHALKERGVETKFVLYPAAGHFPGDPVQGEDVIRRIADWLDQHNK
jgi:dipeptidyl aminopeptidase/acylaminoacyl peptidase